MADSRQKGTATDPAMPAPCRMASRVASWLRCSRLVSPTWRTRVLSLLVRAGVAPWAEVWVGPYCLSFDLTDRYQRQMAVGAYEPETADLLRRVLRPGDNYVDIGAQIGYTAALAAGLVGRQGRMLLVEPDPRAFPRLERHICHADPDTAPAADLRNCACSDAVGSITLLMHPVLGWSRTGHNLIGDYPEVEVSTIVMDDVLAETGMARVRLLKIDVEGHEVSVLRGLGTSLAAHAFDYVLIERNDYMLAGAGYNGTHLHAMLACYGYIGVNGEYQPVTSNHLKPGLVENLFYASSEDLLRAAMPPGYVAAPLPEQEDLSSHLADILDPEAARVAGNRIVYQASKGHVAEAISAGEELLAKHPEMNWLRGHVAHWHLVSGNRAKAREHLLAMHGHDPHDLEVIRLLNQLKGAS